MLDSGASAVLPAAAVASRGVVAVAARRAAAGGCSRTWGRVRASQMCSVFRVVAAATVSRVVIRSAGSGLGRKQSRECSPVQHAASRSRAQPAKNDDCPAAMCCVVAVSLLARSKCVGLTKRIASKDHAHKQYRTFQPDLSDMHQNYTTADLLGPSSASSS